MDKLTSLLLWCAVYLILVQTKLIRAQYRPKWPDPILQREIFVLNLEDGYFGCQVNDSADFLQLFELSKLCDGAPQCFRGSDELSVQLKCTDRNHCHPKMPKCGNGVCLDSLCYCNDGFGGKGCDLPDENECKYRPCDVFAHCTNTMGSFYCSCFPGYDGDGFTCHDINECEVPPLAALCADNAECCNLPGHFVCKCRPGYTGNATESCTDIDECLDPDCCGRGAICQNVPGSYACHCPLGFTGEPATECWDVDECKENPCGEGALCSNLPGGYECSCPAGYRGNPSPDSGCVDVDECLASEKPLCGSHASCVNTPGGYFCQCPAGFTGNPRVSCFDIDECPHACGANTLCTNTPGSYQCNCKVGFLGDPYFSAGCSDEDECSHGQACGVNADCYNTIGSYQCSCASGHSGNPHDFCSDIDECTQSPCGSGAMCTNVPGSYRCDCPDKYLPRGSADIGCDRAAVDVSCRADYDCTTNAACNEGACRCKSGYQPKGIDCMDVDECKTRNICGPNAKCFNLEAGYSCECKQGYEKIEKTTKSKCRDINECLFGKSPCGANSKCVNSDGGYSCACLDGFIGDPKVGCKSPCDGVSCGEHAFCQVHEGNEAACMCDQGFTFDPNNIAAGCVDINECDGAHGPSGLCGQGAICNNVPGSHHCYCPPGFTGDPFRYCEDIDECSRRYGLYGHCGEGSVCQNSLGSYQCSCPPGFTGNPREKCLDVNECSETFGPNGKCGYSAVCTNSPGTYSCRCPPGSSGDPFIRCNAEHTCDTNDSCSGNALCKNGKCLCPAPNHGDDCKHPCEQLFCGEHAKCELDANGLPICSCAPGFVGKSNSLPGCGDIDECAQQPCGRNAVCRNTPGSYECICPHSFRGDPYSECAPEGKEQVTCSDEHPCPAYEECIFNGKANQCVCRRGYVRDKGTEQCRDVNECSELSNTPCGLNAFCTNLDGGYICHCPTGYKGNSYTVCYPDVMRCNKNSECPGNTLCINDTYHGKHCGCDAPYIREGDYCILMSRNCSTNYPCPENQECIFTGSGYGFCICPKGFTLDANGHCRDINECQEMTDWELCGYNADCVNLPGSYQCVCAPGFTGNGKEGCTRTYHSCDADSQCPTNERCLRNWCECLPPFIQDGFTCKHPCDWQQCGQNAECILSPNGTQCQCKPGCTGNANTGCHDINECTSLLPVDPNGPCGSSAICVNVLGSYKCECSTGSEGDPYTSGCLGPARCDSDKECPDDTACDRQAGSCIDSCSSAVCGPSTECISTKHKPTCICKAGYTGNPNDLTNGCVTPCSGVWCADNAQCIVSSQNHGVCRCFDGYTGNPWSGGGCQADYSCSVSRPCPDGSKCVNGMCLEQCKENQCGVGAKCDVHSQRCNCLQFFIGNPDILCVPPLPMPPACNPGCGSYAHCTYSSPNKCVCNSGYSGNPYKTCTPVPKCDNIECGKSATCLEGASSVECVCPAGYHGNPYLGCEDVNECLQGNPCGTGANCINVIGSYQCICPPGKVGNPLYACQPPRHGDGEGGFGCKGSEACPRGTVCYRGSCTQRDACTDTSFCSPENVCNFVNDEAGYQCVDPCDTTQCGPNAFCDVVEHKPSCHCNGSYKGNPNDLDFGCSPFDPSSLTCESDESCGDGSVCRPLATDASKRECVDICENIQCGPNAKCQAIDRRPECVCQSNFDGDPYDPQQGCFPPACIDDSGCSEDETCLLYRKRFRDCQNVCKGYQCGINAVCRGSNHKAVCECRANFKGDAYDSRVGCQPSVPTCSDDASCPDFQACRRKESGLRNCTEVCEHVRCGSNAHCVGRNHESLCECLPGFIGDALHGCQKPPEHLCQTDIDCQPEKTCILTNEGIRDCVDVCYGQRCTSGTFCVGRDHRPTCECLSGYTRLPGDPHGRCAPNLCQANRECHDDEVCAINRKGILDCIPACRGIRCGPNSQCVAKDHEAYCDCKLGFAGNPDDLLRGCPPKDKCRNDNDCESSEVCRLNQNRIKECINGCLGNLCGPNTHCTVSNHFVICSCQEGYTGKPDNKKVGCQPIPHECFNDELCPSNAVCIQETNGINVCRDACDRFLCGENGKCLTVAHKPQCLCQEGFVGDPFHRCVLPDECGPDTDCPEEKVCRSDTSGNKKCVLACLYAKCGRDATCLGKEHQAQCVCPQGFKGDPYSGGCNPVQPNVCEHDADCSGLKTCRSTDAGILDCVDACENIGCGPNAVCKSVDHVGQCHCLPGHIGDGNNVLNGCRRKETNECEIDSDCKKNTDVCKPINSGVKKCFNACKFANCGPNAECIAIDHSYKCNCKENFIRDQNSFCIRREDECVEDVQCPSFQTCRPNSIGVFKCAEVCIDFTCTPNSKCVALHHKGQCDCEPGFTGDPQSRQGCYPLNLHECDSDGDCDANSICLPDNHGIRKCTDACENHNCGGKAVHCNRDRDCPTGEICYQEACRVGCRLDSDCPLKEACTNNQCIDPCLSRTACGTNAVCGTINHDKVCSCREKSVGNPNVECIRVSSVCSTVNECGLGEQCASSVCRMECSSDNECFDNEKCTSGFCSVLCKTDDLCPKNFVCEGGQCAPGCRSDSECPSTDVCINRKCSNACSSPTACGTDAVCQAVSHSVWCSCPPKYTGNPKTECRKIECVVDSDCESGSICQTYKCTVGCRSDQGCPDSQSCVSLQCSDPCRFSGVCGENAVCKASNHQPSCSCEFPFQGNALIRCVQPPPDISACRRDNDCPADKQCLQGKCIVKYECSADKDCAVGHICIKGKCFSGCRRDEDCSLDKGCYSQQCENPCSFRRACGANAQCSPANHKPKCSCAPDFTGNPSVECTAIPSCRRGDDCAVGYICSAGRCAFNSECVSDNECRQREICEKASCGEGCRSHSDCDFISACSDKKCQNPCLTKKCGVNSECFAINHEAVCRCPESYVGDPVHSCSVEQVDCYIDSDCGSEKICVSNRCIVSCRSDSNCPFDKACIQRKCREACSVTGACGHQALCRPINHKPECSCPPNHQGDPKIQCTEIAGIEFECHEENDCGPGKVCTQHYCVSVHKECYSDTACNPGEVCEEDKCIVGCRRDSDCTFDKACFNSKCVNPCKVQTPCGLNAECQPVVHRPRCTCLSKYAGNPYDYCKPIPETPPPECTSDENCELGRVCDIDKCITGCRFDENCPHDRACINRQCLDPCSFPEACGENGQCTPVSHRPRCSCSGGFTGDPNIRCHPIIAPVCLHDADCGTGQICENGKCIDACRTDDTCPYTKACINRRCQNPCSVFGACGRNALCRPENHRPVCSCPSEFRGDAGLVCDREEVQKPEACPSDKECEFGYICEFGSCVEGCRNDDQCTPDKTCNNRVCKNPCGFFNACGANTDCQPNSHRPLCTCKAGFVGDPHVDCRPLQDVKECEADSDCGHRLICDNSHCVIGCRDNQGCSLEESCIHRLCQNPCSFFSVCGRNADCKPSDHTAVCSCPSGYRGNPNLVCTEAPPQCTKDNECLLGQICENSQCIKGCRHDNNCPDEKACINGACQNPCLLPNACGNSANCQPFQHRPRCECVANHRGNPFVKCEPIPDDYCDVDTACSLGTICDRNRCSDGCRNDGNCRFEEACINRVCQNPCSIYGACGVNAICKPVDHDRVCTCLPDFTGDPRILCERTQPPPECTTDKQCPLGQICTNDRCIHGCRTSSNCPSDKACVKSKCINACAVSGACGRGATCTPANHVAVCNCPSGFRGDPDVECKEIPPECRTDDDCGLERICLKQKCIVGCRTHSNCPYDKACVNGFCQSPCDIGGMCGVNTICRAEKHEAHCTCSPGYTGDPLRQCSKIFVECEIDTDCGSGYVCAHHQCKDINECLKETLPCGSGASCQNLPGWYKCSCPLPLIGNAYGTDGCRSPIPVCFHDADCKDDQKCNPASNECYDVCSKPGVCGKRALCKAVKSKAECECLPGHRGNPYVECSICDSCSRHLDCPGNLLCLGEYCGCPHPYRQQSSFCVLTSVNCSTTNPCPRDQQCVYSGKDHSGGYCTCNKGFMLMFDGRCTDVNECEEKPFPCGPGAKCINTVGEYQCECPANTYGNPYEGGCTVEPQRRECLNDGDCPNDRSCIDFSCGDPCLIDHNCGHNALCRINDHKKECVCKSGFIGNPLEVCRPLVECTSDSNCPGNLICLPDHRCGCPLEYNRVFDYCLKTSENCTTTNPCDDNEECVYTGSEHGLCVCPRGYKPTAHKDCEDINECRDGDEHICAAHAVCVNIQGSYECRCLDGYEGDAYREGCQELIREPPGCSSDFDCPSSKKCDSSSGECYDPCSVKGALEYKCGSNAICRTDNHQPACYCPPNYEGNPHKVCLPIRVCGVTYNCPGNLVCLDSHTCGCPPSFFRENDYCFIKSQNCTTTNPCETNEECVYTGDRTGFCVCPHGYELQPTGECRVVRICEENNPCAAGAICRDKPGSYECVCPIDTIGDPYLKGCKPIIGCTTDHDCPQDRECDTSKQCISPCHICGPNAECTVRDHKAICVCTHGKVGEPYNKQMGCFTPPPPDVPPEVRTIPPVQDLTVMCLADGVQVAVKLGGYDGIIYVKGHSQDPTCRRLVTSNEIDAIDFKVPFGHCGLLHVDGEASFILVVQKHPKLVTYRARAYHIKCVYDTGERTVTLGFNVSMITTSGTIANTGPPPTCLMSICTLNGREISSAEIGDDLLLKVDVQPDFIYGGFARSCVAKTMEEDGEFQYEVTDANGCATDPSIFGNWEYDPHQKTLMARFNAFKFPSSNNLRFQCNIRVCFGSCPPVNCEGVDAYGKRRKRQVKDEDLLLTDTFKEGALREEILVQSNAILTFEKRDPQPSQPIEGPRIEDIDHVCLPKLGLIISMIITTLLALVAVAVAISCWLMAYRRKPKRQGPLPHPPEFPNPLYTTPEPVAEPSPDYYPTSQHM